MFHVLKIFVRISSVVFSIGCFGLPISSFPISFEAGTVYSFDYLSESLFNSPDGRPVGFLFSANLEVTPVWISPTEEILLKLNIVANPRLQGAYQHEISRSLLNLPNLPIYFQWSGGKVNMVYVHEEDTTLAVNIKKGIAGLFQFQVEGTKINEVDVAGTCEVEYRVNSESHISKRKQKCQTFNDMLTYSTATKLFDLDLNRTSEINFRLDGDKLISVFAIETWQSINNFDSTLATSINIRQNLTFEISKISGKTAVNVPKENVLKKLNKGKGGALKDMTLETNFKPFGCLPNMPCSSISELVKSLKLDLSPNMIGRKAATQSVFQILNALRLAGKESIVKVLKETKAEAYFLSLVDIVVAAQTEDSLAALKRFLDFKNEKQIEILERFLLGVALSTHPTKSTIQYLLDLFKIKLKNEALRESIGEALGSISYTYSKINKHEELIEEVAKEFMSQLNESVKSSDSKYQVMIIRALSNAAFAECFAYLLELAETSTEGGVSEAALLALRRYDKSAIAKNKETFQRIFHQRMRGYETPVRSLALAYLLDLAPSLEETRAIFMESFDPWNTDYSLYIQSRLNNAAKQHVNIRENLEEILRNTSVNNYHVLSPKGSSLAFTSNLLNTPSTSYFMYVENGRSGIMKRSGMNVQILQSDKEIPIYNFGIFAGGLENLIGDEIDESEKDTVVTAGLRLDMVGVALRPVTFFTGQAGLMSAIWSAPADLVSALQTNFLMQDHLSYAHLQNGLVAEVFLQGIVSLDLSGSLAVSLWNKNAKSLVQSRGAVLMRGGVRLDTSTFKSGVEYSQSLESMLDFSTDVEFYDGNKMCLQMSRPPTMLERKFTKYENARGFKTSWRSKRTLKRKFEGVSYPLPSANYQKCRELMKIS